MNTERLLPIVSLAFAVLMAVLYFMAMRDEAVEVAEPATTPAAAVAEAAPKPKAKARTKPKVRKSSRPKPMQPEPPPSAEPEVTESMTISGKVLLSSGRVANKAKVVAYIKSRRRVYQLNGAGEFNITEDGGTIRLRAERMDGQLLQHSDWVDFDGTDGGTWEVDLILPETKRGGLGVRIGKHADGIRIKSVLPGSPAEELGLAKGDVVLEVGGQPATEFSLGEFASQMTGDAGTTQSFFVRRRDGTEQELTFERRAIER